MNIDDRIRDICDKRGIPHSSVRPLSDGSYLLPAFGAISSWDAIHLMPDGTILPMQGHWERDPSVDPGDADFWVSPLDELTCQGIPDSLIEVVNYFYTCETPQNCT